MSGETMGFRIRSFGVAVAVHGYRTMMLFESMEIELTSDYQGQYTRFPLKMLNP